MQIDKNCDRKLSEFINGDDLDFYEEYTINLSDEEQREFFTDNPDFMREFPVSRDKIYLLRDSVFRGILRRIKEYEGGKRNMLKKIIILIFACTMLVGCNQKQSQDISNTSFETIDTKEERDTTPPVISGLDEGAIVEVEYGEEFNLENYLNNQLIITDDLSELAPTYSFSISDAIMNVDTADIDTTIPGEYPVVLTAADEVGNETVLNFTLKINNLHITKENPHPVVYDGEYGKVTLSDIRYGTEAGVTGYHFTFDIENKASSDMAAYLGDTYINDYKISAYTDISIIASGRKGSMESNIRDEDMIPEMEGFTQIESVICISTNPLMGDMYTSIPVIIDKDVVN